MTFDLETPFASVQLASLDERPISEAKRMLLVTGSRVANTGMKWLDDTRRSLGGQWGDAPTRIEPVSGTLILQHLRNANEVILKPLDNRGQLLGEGERLTREDDAWRIAIPVESATLWYLIEVRR
jgi:hypothetical protein